MSSYKTDRAIEQRISNWMDKYYYPNLKCTAERIHDMKRQCLGIDIILNGKICIDEKAKYRSGYFNKIIPSIGFEIDRFCRDGQRRIGWYVDSQAKTTHYSILSIFADCRFPEDITVENIYKIVNLTISKKQLKALTEKYWTSQELIGQSNILRRTRNARTDSANPDIWITLTPPEKYIESPCNIVVTRSALKSLPSSREIEITKESIRLI